MTNKFGGEVGRKASGIDLRGRKTLRDNPENIRVFPGFDAESERKKIDSRFNVALLFDPESEREINNDIIV